MKRMVLLIKSIIPANMHRQDLIHRFSIATNVLLVAFSIGACENKPAQNAEKELLKADSLFSVLSVREGMQKAFLAYLDSNAVLIRQNHMPIEGMTSIKNYFEGFSDSTFILTWRPLKARLSDDSTMGFTYGIYQITENVTGKQTGTGSYVTIWQKDKNGEWKAVFDTGNEGLGI